MHVAGFWRRFVCVTINWGLIIITLGGYFVFMALNYFKGEQDLGMKVAKITWSDNRQLRFLLFWFLSFFIYFIPIPFYIPFVLFLITPFSPITFFYFLPFFYIILNIPFLIEIVMICLKKGTFAEQISGTYLVIDDFEPERNGRERKEETNYLINSN